MKTTSQKLFAAAALLLVVPSMAMAQVTGTVTDEIDGTCYKTTFEGGGQFTQVAPDTNGLIPNTPIRFPLSGSWVTVTAAQFSNNPSGTTIAVWVNGAPTANVTFEDPVSTVSFFFASIPDVVLNAYDAHGNLVATSSGASNVQPTGFDVWDPIGVDAGANVITRITITGGSGATAIDDFHACTVITDPVELLENLIIDVAEINLAQGISNAVDAKLDAAFSAIIDANENNDVAACNVLDALVHFVEVQWDHGKLTDEQAVFLIDSVDQIIELLCPT